MFHLVWITGGPPERFSGKNARSLCTRAFNVNARRYKQKFGVYPLIYATDNNGAVYLSHVDWINVNPSATTKARRARKIAQKVNV